VLLCDGTWTWARVIGQRKDRHGRWCIGLRWYASPAVGGREGWFLLDTSKIRRPGLRPPAALYFPATPACGDPAAELRRRGGPTRCCGTRLGILEGACRQRTQFVR
jgi:hypothetical protein